MGIQSARSDCGGRAMNYRPTWNLASIPDPVLASENGRRSSAKRKVRSGGRPMICGGCGDCKQCELKRKRQHSEGVQA